ncbi:hypothetical protein BOX15_Mlig013471g1, partial [Macrostomum lignano]
DYQFKILHSNYFSNIPAAVIMSDRNSVVNSILQELEWDDGLAIPVANDDNKRLIALVESLNKAGTSAGNEIEHVDDKVTALEAHIKNVRQELMQTQALFQARVHEVETEQHITKVSEREEGRLNQEIRRLDKEISNSKATKNQLENNIFKQTAQLEEMKAQMNWNQQALEAWLEESEKKTEDSLALQKYTRQDEGKIRELSLQLERLTDERNAKKVRLDNLVIETQTTQVELDKAAEQFRQAHQERQDLIRQWEGTIKRMETRDKEIELLAAQLARAKQVCREKEELIKEKQNFLDSEKDNNTEMEKRIGVAERNAGKIRLEYQEAEVQRANFQNELDSLKRTVDRTNKDLELARSDITHLKSETAAKKTKLEVTGRERAGLEDHLKRVQNDRLSAEQQAANMDELMKSEEVGQKEMEKELKSLREQQFRSAQQLHDAKTEERMSEATIMGNRAALRNLNAKIAKLDHDLLKQQEILYNQDFSIQQLQRRISRMSGETNSDEKVALEARIKELNADLDQRVQVATTLSGQLRQLQDEIRRCKRDMDKTKQEKGDLSTKIEELSLHNDNSTREAGRIVQERQSVMVDENLMRLEVKRLRDQLNNRADRVMSEDKRKLQFETAMKERREEIGIHKEMLQAQIRSADDERQQVSSELHEREAKIDKLQKRYEIIMVSMAPPEGEEERSQAYYVIKAAQDREELQRRGDQLDAQIRKAEKECRALENTLRLMNSCNENYRQTFSKVGPTSDEAAQREQLDQQMRAVTDKYKAKRRQIREMEEELQTMQEALENLAKDDALYREQVGQLEQLVGQRERERSEHQAKLERADKAIARAKGPSVAAPIEADIGLRELREFNRRVASEVLRVAQSTGEEVASTAESYMQQSGVPLPTTGTGMAGSASAESSARSSARSSVRSSAASVASRGSATPTGAAVAAVPGRVNIGTELPKSPSGSQPMSRRSSTSSTASRSRRQ